MLVMTLKSCNWKCDCLKLKLWEKWWKKKKNNNAASNWNTNYHQLSLIKYWKNPQTNKKNKQTPLNNNIKKITLSSFYDAFLFIWKAKHYADSYNFKISNCWESSFLYTMYTLWGNANARKLTFCYLFLLGWECYHWVHEQNSEHVKEKNPTQLQR